MSGNDTVRLPNGKTVTKGRARALGLIDREGNFTEKALADSAAEKAQAKAQRAAEWRRSQGLEPDLNEDGTPKPVVPIQPLRPGNIDAEGNPVTDPELLAEIAARTAQIEAGQAAADADFLTGGGGIPSGAGEEQVYHDTLQPVYDEALAKGILEEPVDAAEAITQGVTSASVETRDGEEVLVEQVAGAVEGVESPSSDEVAEAIAESESLADVIQAHEEAKASGLFEAASEGEGDATDEG